LVTFVFCFEQKTTEDDERVFCLFLKTKAQNSKKKKIPEQCLLHKTKTVCEKSAIFEQNKKKTQKVT